MFLTRNDYFQGRGIIFSNIPFGESKVVESKLEIFLGNPKGRIQHSTVMDHIHIIIIPRTFYLVVIAVVFDETHVNFLSYYAIHVQKDRFGSRNWEKKLCSRIILK